ncbi:hypothetical protein AMTRI_Chr02g262250 [Amborella trichopoda]
MHSVHLPMTFMFLKISKTSLHIHRCAALSHGFWEWSKFQLMAWLDAAQAYLGHKMGTSLETLICNYGSWIRWFESFSFLVVVVPYCRDPTKRVPRRQNELRVFMCCISH